MPSAIDINEGYLIWRHPGSLMYVYMKVSEPGVYVDQHKNPVPVKLAGEAGADIATFAKQRQFNERRATLSEALAKELKMGADEVNQKVLAEAGGLKLVEVSLGMVNIIDPAGNRLNLAPMPKKFGQAMFKTFADDVEDEPKPAK